MIASRSGAGMLALALLCVGCDEAVPPPVAVREPSFEAEDMAVMRALFDDFRRERREAAKKWRIPPPHFMVVDTTMAMCPRDPGIFGDRPGRCLLPSSVALLSEVVPERLARTVALKYPIWAAKPLLITGPLGDDVTLVSATLLDTVGGELLRQHPGSMIVWLSALGYPAPGTAVLRFSNQSSVGAARIERQGAGRWRVAARVNHSIE